MRLRPLAVLALVLLPVAGCLVSSRSNTEVVGTRISEETLSLVKPGSTRNDVLSLLGEPTSRKNLDDGTKVWRYAYRVEKRSSGGVFLLISSSSRTTKEEGTVVVVLEEDRVTRAWRE
jgi:outer membrane protein assembly factor BamE (lipoprotein component of BamABCDE complex)